MTHTAGRTLKLYWGDESPIPLIAGIKEKSVTINGEAIDVTDDGDSGWRTKIAAVGIKSIDIRGSGVTDDDVLLADIMNGNNYQNAVIEFPSGATLSGKFALDNFTVTGELEGATTFECTLASAGQITYTAAP